MNLKNLSDVLGLSQTTVSRALNGYPEVSELTRRRVIEAAQRYGYRPNPHATRLATGRAMAIGHVIPMSSQNSVMNPIFADFAAGANETYARHGYEMTLSIVRDEEVENKYRSMAETGSVDGIIASSPMISDPRIEVLNRIGLPFLVHGRSSATGYEYNWLDINNFRAFRVATEFLIHSGHRRIALLNGPEQLDFAFRRRRGYLDALRRNGVGHDPGLVRSSEMTEPFGHESVIELMRLEEPPTAFLTASILTAIGARRALHDLNILLGTEVSLVTHDDSLDYFGNSGTEPVFTSVRSSIRAAGRRSAQILLDIILGQREPPVTELWEAELVIGKSTGPGPHAGWSAGTGQ
ncbi:MAG: LacI family DNA-binding transcriptional regulator [Rhodobacteraceae bacterium]|nr:LacI family DNA-binding transcriptional regulator [Paracoccaceae bacterium]